MADIDTHKFLRIGDGGYTIPWLHLTQLNVPTEYDLAGLSLDDLHQTLQVMNSTAKAPREWSATLSPLQAQCAA
jgi:hypothetical protein